MIAAFDQAVSSYPCGRVVYILLFSLVMYLCQVADHLRRPFQHFVSSRPTNAVLGTQQAAHLAQQPATVAPLASWPASNFVASVRGVLRSVRTTASRAAVNVCCLHLERSPYNPNLVNVEGSGHFTYKADKGKLSITATVRGSAFPKSSVSWM